jgi:integrase
VVPRKRRRRAARALKTEPTSAADAVRESRVFRKGAWYHIDLRWREGGRPVLRDPHAPAGGARTADEDTAREWAQEYDRRWREEQDKKNSRRPGEHRTLAGAIEAFLKHRSLHRASSTVSGDRTALTQLYEEVGGARSPASVTSSELQTFCDGFLAAGYASSSVCNTFYHLSAFFQFAKVIPNPVDGIELPKAVPTNVVPWSPEECDRLREAADAIDAHNGDRDRTRRRLVEFLLATGLRIQEAAAARWERIDESERTIYVDAQIGRDSGRSTLPKRGIIRTAAILPSWWGFHAPGATGLLFSEEQGKPVPYRRLYDWVVEVLRNANLKKKGEAAHQFRHTYAFDFLKRGGSIHHLAKCLGHGSIKTTEKYYDRFTSDHAARAAAEQFYGGRTMRGPRKGRRGGA